MVCYDVGLWDSGFGAGGVGEDEDLTDLGFEESGVGGAVFAGDKVEPEVGIDVAIGVEDVLTKPRDAAAADAVELWAD